MTLILKEKVEAIYEPLIGKSFKGRIHKKNSEAVCTGGPRDVVVVDNDDVGELMTAITNEVDKVSAQYEPYDEEKVWKGIIIHKEHGPTLWVESYEGDDHKTHFTVKSIEVLTDLNWVKRNYKAMVNITLE